MNIKQLIKAKKSRIKPIKENRKLELEYYRELKQLANILKADVNEFIISNLKAYEVSKPTDNAFNLISMFEMLRNKWNGLRQLSSIPDDIVQKVNLNNKNKFLSQVNRLTGIDMETLINEENLNDIVALQRQKQKILIKSIPEEFLKSVETVVTNGLSQGLRPEAIAKELKGIKGINSTFGKLENRVKLIARNEISTINGNLSKARAESAGVTKAIWKTNIDGRERECHKARHNQEFDLNKGCYNSCDGKTIFPSQEINCRCNYIFVLDED